MLVLTANQDPAITFAKIENEASMQLVSLDNTAMFPLQKKSTF